MTFFDWVEAKVLLRRSVTPKEGEATAEKEMTPTDHVRHSLQIDVAEKAGDKRPTLVYFHWPHEDPVNGKLVEKLCTSTLNNEAAARWGKLFRCVQVDMASSDPRLVALLGAGSKPSFVVVNAQAEVVARIPPLTSSDKVAKALETALQKFPEDAKRLKDALAEQDVLMEKAKAAVKADKFDEAKAHYDKVRFSNVRVGPQFDRAQVDGYDLDMRIERQRAKSGSGR
jgi:hypothetical protein